jgi:hypothetical protein
VDHIANRADGLFVFAATAVRYICSLVPQVHPQKSVDFLLGGAHLTDIHSLYYTVVGEAIRIPDQEDLRGQDYYNNVRRILRTIVLLLKPQSPWSLAKLLGMDVGDLRRTLHPLSAVIYFPSSGGTIKIYHLSFREFITSPIQNRRPDLLCGTKTQQGEMASDILQVMETELKFNICDLPTSYLKNVDMPNIKQSIQANIPEHLQYACLFWADHVTAIPYNHKHGQAMEKFLLNKFLFWLETLSLLGTVGSAYQTLSKFISWAPGVIKFTGSFEKSELMIKVSGITKCSVCTRWKKIHGAFFRGNQAKCTPYLPISIGLGTNTVYNCSKISATISVFTIG